MSIMSYFFYDPNEGVRYFATEAAALEVAERAIGGYREESEGGEWAEDDLAMLIVGRVTHSAQQILVRHRPPLEALDESNYDDDGVCWDDGVDVLCDYAMRPLTEKEGS